MPEPARHDVVGIDGCKGGFLAVHGPPEAPSATVFSDFAGLCAAFSGAIMAIDMPIGLPDLVQGGRMAERLARKLLTARQSSLFALPSRRAVEAGQPTGSGMAADRQAYARACAAALETSVPPRKVSKQAFYLFDKIMMVDRQIDLDRELSVRLYETHPEVAYAVLTGREMALPKRVKGKVNPAGLALRLKVLEEHGLTLSALAANPPRGASADDVADAGISYLVARRLVAGLAVSFPDPPERDGKGRRMAIFA